MQSLKTEASIKQCKHIYHFKMMGDGKKPTEVKRDVY